MVINVDNAIGAPLADILMPGHSWDEIRARNEVPFEINSVSDKAEEILLTLKENA